MSEHTPGAWYTDGGSDLERMEDLCDELNRALSPFACLAMVMEEGQILNFRGVYISHEQVLAAADAVSKAGTS